MSAFLHRLGLWCAKHAKRVLGIWIGLLIVLGGGIAVVGMHLDNTFQISGTESLDGLNVLAERLPQAAGTSEQVLFTAKDGIIASHREAVEQFVTSAKDLPGISLVSDPFASETNTVTDDGAHALVTVQADSSIGTSVGEAGTKAVELANQLEALGDQASTDSPGLLVQFGGNIGQSVKIEMSGVEAIGLALAAIILFLTFGSIVAAGAPIISALIGVGAGMLALLLAGAVWSINSTTPVLAVMIGLAVGIDYALFIISRAREYLAEGIDPREAAGRATATAGSAVLFAGTTVIVALCGLSVAGIPFLTSMGVASAGVVAVAVAVALTVVPALIGLLGQRLAPKQRSTRTPHRTAERWINAITKIPALTVVGVIGLLGVAAIPLSGVNLALTDNGFEPKGTVQRDTYDAIADAYGAGYNSPIIVIANIVHTTDPQGVVADLSNEIGSLDGVARIALATPNEDGSLAFLQIIPKEGQADAQTTALVKTIRADAPEYEQKFGISDVMVTGRTAVAIDVADRLNGALLPFGIVVVGLSLILLMVVFRSIAVPITATLGYLLSLGAGMGAVGLVFGWGWFADLLNVTKVGAVISFLPVIVMGVLFGLAMDYQVFLVSRMREEWIRTHDAQKAVRAGFVGSARVVVAAAAIMTGVFAAFIPDGMVYIKPIAVGLTVGIAADAFLVRMTFIPAIMALLGEKAWWLPASLERLFPVVDIEGEGLERSLEHAAWVEEHGTSELRMEDVTVADGNTAIDGLNLVLFPGELGVVRSDDVVARIALSAVIGARLRVTSGKVVVGHHVLPDGTALVQGMTATIDNYDDPVSDRARIVVVDDPGSRRWRRVGELLAEGKTVVVTGTRDLTVPNGLTVAAGADLDSNGTAVRWPKPLPEREEDASRELARVNESN